MINEIVSVPNKIKLCMLTESKNKRLGGFPTLFVSFNKNVKHLERTNEREGLISQGSVKTENILEPKHSSAPLWFR